MRKLRTQDIERPTVEQLAAREPHPISVVIENVRSAYNVGSILRTCDAAHVRSVVIAGYSPTPDHRKVRKTALGAEASVPWTRVQDGLTAVEMLRAEGHKIAVLEITDVPTAVDELQIRHYPLALVVGNEVTGVSEDVVAASDVALEIPQYGLKHSLNVAVAFGIVAMGAVERFRNIRPRPI
jgi:tRNA G18 (ribose-2'-O)-methylase SpoU